MNKRIQEMFEGLPKVYEFVNHVVSLGLDISWRKRAASLAAARGGAMWLDVSTGTGEMAAYLRRLAGPSTVVVATDFSMPMLLEAKRKREARGKKNATCEQEAWGTEQARSKSKILFVIADTGCLPFKPNSFDLVTISLGTRNITTSRESLVSCLAEFLRILTPAGWFVNLETSQPKSRIVRSLFHKYVESFLRPVGAAISRSRDAYTYLSSTIRGFYGPDELTQIIKEAGFEAVSVSRLCLGVAAVHKARKPQH